MTEDQLLTGLCEALGLSGWTYIHLGGDQRGVYRGQIGWPDLFAISPGGARALAWEIKGDGGKVRPEQWAWIVALRTALPSLDVRIVRPVDYDAALAWILYGSGGRVTT